MSTFVDFGRRRREGGSGSEVTSADNKSRHLMAGTDRNAQRIHTRTHATHLLLQ